MQKCYKVFTKKLANILCRQGFQIVRTELNNSKPWLYVYLFEDSEELRQAIEKYIQGGKGNDRID